MRSPLCKWGVTTAGRLTSCPVRLRKAPLDYTMSIDNWPFGLYAGQPEVSQQEKDKSMYKLLRFRETAADYRGRDSQVPGISSDVRSEREH
jgi:hypothetical protein